VQATLAAGRYIARFGIVDAKGQRGSLQHTFTVPAWNAGAIRVSDVILGEGRGNAFAPAARVSSSGADDRAHGRARLIVEVRRRPREGDDHPRRATTRR
jgi:hypothetical protein